MPTMTEPVNLNQEVADSFAPSIKAVEAAQQLCEKIASGAKKLPDPEERFRIFRAAGWDASAVEAEIARLQRIGELKARRDRHKGAEAAAGKADKALQQHLDEIDHVVAKMRKEAEPLAEARDRAHSDASNFRDAVQRLRDHSNLPPVLKARLDEIRGEIARLQNDTFHRRRLDLQQRTDPSPATDRLRAQVEAVEAQVRKLAAERDRLISDWVNC